MLSLRKPRHESCTAYECMSHFDLTGRIAFSLLHAKFHVHDSWKLEDRACTHQVTGTTGNHIDNNHLKILKAET